MYRGGDAETQPAEAPHSIQPRAAELGSSMPLNPHQGRYPSPLVCLPETVKDTQLCTKLRWRGDAAGGSLQAFGRAEFSEEELQRPCPPGEKI